MRFFVVVVVFSSFLFFIFLSNKASIYGNPAFVRVSVVWWISMSYMLCHESFASSFPVFCVERRTVDSQLFGRLVVT